MMMFELRSRGFSEPLLDQPFSGWHCAPPTGRCFRRSAAPSSQSQWRTLSACRVETHLDAWSPRASAPEILPARPATVFSGKQVADLLSKPGDPILQL